MPWPLVMSERERKSATHHYVYAMSSRNQDTGDKSGGIVRNQYYTFAESSSEFSMCLWLQHHRILFYFYSEATPRKTV